MANNDSDESFESVDLSDYESDSDAWNCCSLAGVKVRHRWIFIGNNVIYNFHTL